MIKTKRKTNGGPFVLSISKATAEAYYIQRLFVPHTHARTYIQHKLILKKLLGLLISDVGGEKVGLNLGFKCV